MITEKEIFKVTRTVTDSKSEKRFDFFRTVYDSSYCTGLKNVGINFSLERQGLAKDLDNFKEVVIRGEDSLLSYKRELFPLDAQASGSERIHIEGNLNVISFSKQIENVKNNKQVQTSQELVVIFQQGKYLLVEKKGNITLKVGFHNWDDDDKIRKSISYQGKQIYFIIPE